MPGTVSRRLAGKSRWLLAGEIGSGRANPLYWIWDWFAGRCGTALMAIAIFLAGPTGLYALDAEDLLVYHKGPFTARPQMSFSEVYNDNVFYQGSEQVRDFISILSPGMEFQLGKPEHNMLLLTYGLDELIYTENPDLNASQHTVKLKSQFETQRLRLDGEDRFQLLSSPLGGVVERVVGPDGVFTPVRRNVERLTFDDGYTLAYAAGEKATIYLRGSHYSTDYRQTIALYDIETLTGTGGFGYRAFPKTVVFGEVYYSRTTTDPNDPRLVLNPRLDAIGGYFGLRGNFTSKLSGTAKVGWEQREFADGTGADGSPVVDLSLSQMFSEKQLLALTYSRMSTVSVQYNRQTYTADSVGVRFTQLLGGSRKWQVGVGATYSMYQYERTPLSTVATEYDLFRGSVSLGYQVQRWLSAVVGYDFERVTGNSSGVIDYTVNRATLRLAIGY